MHVRARVGRLSQGGTHEARRPSRFFCARPGRRAHRVARRRLPHRAVVRHTRPSPLLLHPTSAPPPGLAASIISSTSWARRDYGVWRYYLAGVRYYGVWRTAARGTRGRRGARAATLRAGAAHALSRHSLTALTARQEQELWSCVQIFKERSLCCINYYFNVSFPESYTGLFALIPFPPSRISIFCSFLRQTLSTNHLLKFQVACLRIAGSMAAQSRGTQTHAPQAPM